MTPEPAYNTLFPGPLLHEALYDDLAAFFHAAEPHGAPSAADLRSFDGQRLTGQHRALTLARADGSLVGLAESDVPRSHDRPGWYALKLSVRPGWHGGGFPETLLERAEAHLPQDVSVLLTTLREGDWQETFLKARGFTEHERMWSSELDLRSFDPAAFQHHTERASAAGLRAAPLSELADLGLETEQRRLYALTVQLLTDVPFAEPLELWPFDTWKRRIVDAAEFDPDGLFVLLSPEGDWVGMSELYRPSPGRPGTLYQGLTGVRRQWRGLGGAWLLKLTAAAQAIARGYVAARTNNHTGNAPMLAINDQLGFVREAARLTLRRDYER